MTDSELWLKGIDLATIATWLMIIGFAVLLYLARSGKPQSSRRSGKK